MSAPGTLFGFTEAEVASFGVTFGLGALMLYMLFIIGNLAWRSRAGRTGTLALFFVLAFGMTDFVTKIVLEMLWKG